VNRQQIILVTAAISAVFLLYFFGRFSAENKPASSKPAVSATNQQQPGLSFDTMLSLAKKRLTPYQLKKVLEWENSVVRGDVKNQQINVYKQLSNFWKDSVGAFVPYVKYIGEAAKLEKSEKNLTFAAHLLLAELQTVEEQPLKVWMAKEAKELFETALELNPQNDSTKIGLGSTYFFGAAGNDPPMKGIGLIREVVTKNPDNAYANYMLGVGSFVSAQWPKAIERFEKVLQLEPQNIDAMLRLADAYEQSGDKASSKKWYLQFLKTIKLLETQKKFRTNPEMIKQIEEHIKLL